MIIILEGLNGVGKTTYARALAERLDIPIVRPFRREGQHLGREDGGRQQRFHDLGIPVNTYVEDVFTAEFLGSTGYSAVLDRGMGSAVAYGMLYGTLPNADTAERVLNLWEETIQRHPDTVIYVNMVARPEVRKARCKNRWSPDVEQTAVLEKWFKRVFQTIELDKMQIDTSDIPSPADGAVRICERAELSLNA